MHDALLRNQADETPTLTDWSNRVSALINDYIDRHAIVDVQSLAETLAAATGWPGCPHARDVAGDGVAAYRRIPLSNHESRNYEALLILWPPGHATPIHDHAGLWGLELVLDGALEVEAFSLSLQPAPRLVPRDQAMLGIGDHAAFSGADYAHCCRNLSSQQPALSLHIYGGALDAYRSFHQQGSGDWTSVEHQVQRELALV
ncbi:cysteine dioxygenase family protein [Rhodanobacter sp. Si-c]|uniref:Cysteine dioxygenase family protein n=1 Tax=Rhodanobacter lycopersici TaxID=3162487 RepID=A0ABV3Q9M0_9GAMM